MHITPHIFRDYDIRAIIPDELDPEGATRIAQSLSQQRTVPDRIAGGRRVSSQALHLTVIASWRTRTSSIAQPGQSHAQNAQGTPVIERLIFAVLISLDVQGIAPGGLAGVESCGKLD